MAINGFCPCNRRPATQTHCIEKNRTKRACMMPVLGLNYEYSIKCCYFLFHSFPVDLLVFLYRSYFSFHPLFDGMRGFRCT